MSVTRELVHYIIQGEVVTSFIKTLELKDGSAKSYDCVVKLCDDRELDSLHKLCGLGKDGVSVMLGRKGGD